MVPTHPHTLVNGSISSGPTEEGKQIQRSDICAEDKLMITSPLPLHIRFVHQFRGEIAADIIKIKNFPKRDFPCSLLQPDSPIMSDIKGTGGYRREMVLTGCRLS